MIQNRDYESIMGTRKEKGQKVISILFHLCYYQNEKVVKGTQVNELRFLNRQKLII